MQCRADLQDFVRGWGALHGPLDHDTGGQDFLQQAGHYAGACSMWQVCHTIGGYHQPALAKPQLPSTVSVQLAEEKGGEGHLTSAKQKQTATAIGSPSRHPGENDST